MYQLTGVVIESIAEEGEQVVVGAVAAAATGLCPACGAASARVHSRYSRVLVDLPSCGRAVRVRLSVRRFRCASPACERRTFAEQVPGVTRHHGRLLLRLEAVLAACCVALGGEAGARLAGRIGLTVGGDTLLRLLRRGEGAPTGTPRVLGVDDWAWRRGERYGLDLEAGRPVDLLPECTAAALEQWLREHPGVEVIVRDRSTEYARGAAAGAPAAVQVVDRWHVLRNVREVAERVLDRHAEDLRGLPAEGPGAGLPPRRRSSAEEARREDVRHRVAAHYAEIQRPTAVGETISGIARRLGITRIMVRRYRFAAAPPQGDYARRASQLDPFEPYLRRSSASAATRVPPDRFRGGRRSGAPSPPPPRPAAICPPPMGRPPLRPPRVGQRCRGWRGPSSATPAALMTPNSACSTDSGRPAPPPPRPTRCCRRSRG